MATPRYSYYCLEAGCSIMSLKGLGQITLIKTHNSPNIVINGFKLNPNTPYPFYSPSTHSSIPLMCHNSNGFIENINDTSIDKTSEHYEKIYKKITNSDILAVFKLDQTHRNPENHSIQTPLKCLQLFNKIFKDPEPKISKNANPIKFGNSENNFIENRVNEKSRIVCIGPANSGKSTFNRYLVNKLLSNYQSVIYVDLDPGQTEFTPPSFLSVVKLDSPILGPPYTHNFGEINVVKTAFLGNLSPGTTCHRYMECVESLVEYVDKYLSCSGSPIVVNFMGWMEGLGLKLLGDCCRLINPTDIVQLDSRSKRGACDVLDADYLYDNGNTIYYKNKNGELVEPISTPEFLLVSRQNENDIEQSKSKNLNIPAWQHREMMIDMQIETVLTKTVQIPLKNLCLSVLSDTVQEHLYPAAINGQLVAIFSEMPNNRKMCYLLPNSRSSRSSSPDNKTTTGTLNQNTGFNKFSAFGAGLSSSSNSESNNESNNQSNNGSNSQSSSESDEVSKFETCKIYKPVETECIGMGFVCRIEGNLMDIKISENIDPKKIVYVVKGDAKSLALNPNQVKRLANVNDYVENFERENVIRGADYFIKTKRVFK